MNYDALIESYEEDISWLETEKKRVEKKLASALYYGDYKEKLIVKSEIKTLNLAINNAKTKKNELIAMQQKNLNFCGFKEKIESSVHYKSIADLPFVFGGK